MKTKYLIARPWLPWGWLLLVTGFGLGLFSMFSGWEPAWLDARVPDFFDNSITIGQDTTASEAEKDASWPQWIDNNLVDELALTFLLIGALILVLVRRQQEDEFIMKLRLESLLWAAIANGALLLLTVWLVYDLSFYFVMVSALFLFYFLFLLRFEWSLMQFKRFRDEE